jgi:hypothetical protein
MDPLSNNKKDNEKSIDIFLRNTLANKLQTTSV